ncbi:hypothetical protein V6N13_093302 [Hibiscus sabdariffa]
MQNYLSSPSFSDWPGEKHEDLSILVFGHRSCFDLTNKSVCTLHRLATAKQRMWLATYVLKIRPDQSYEQKGNKHFQYQ